MATYDRMTRTVTLALLAALSSVSSTAADEAAVAEGPLQTAIFAGGCFWCMEPPFDALDGVVSTISGYTGGDVAEPTYEQVSAGTTGHTEAVAVRYDPGVVGYERLLEVFWHNVDPLDAGGQFCDRGEQYRSAIFYRTERQKEFAERSKNALNEDPRLSGRIATQIVAAGEFYPAEDYHQDYYEKNPIRYKFYRFSCGRDARLDEVWPQREAGSE